MTNHVSTGYCVVAKNKNANFVDIGPSACLDVEMIDSQTSFLNRTKRGVVISDMISQSQGDRANKKKAKRIQDFVTGNVKSYSRILNDDKSLKNSKTTIICLLVWWC